MDDRKLCIRCGRAIDAFASICPFCNWDQSDTAVPRVETAVEPAYVPPDPERDLRKYLLMAGGGVLLLIVAFSLGLVVHGKNLPKTPTGEAVEKTSTVAVKPAPHADVTLVPVNETSGFEPPITSAPPPNPEQGVPNEYQRSDATAVSSAEYAQLAARAQAEKKQAKPMVDPRSLTGPAYDQGAPARPQISSASPDDEADRKIVVRTQPVPEYQPVPPLDVAEPVTVRLRLTVGADGRVHGIDILQGAPGLTPRVIATVQTWRFKPATENGRPVSATFSVDLSFRNQ
ncbi:MAG TPA: TonB family protein [Thermoanaerobaculia bacterium]|nr:TonB family protein [Thermoanaerobaculia bacterium]